MAAAKNCRHLAAGRRLEPAPPRTTGGSDRYRVRFDTTTGLRNRWFLTGQDIVYPDRRAEDRKLLTYTSAPLARATEVTGTPVVSLELASTATDGAVFTYLADVAPDGRVTYVTEGELRGLHRKVSTGKPPFPIFGPYHSFDRADAQPLVPGRQAALAFALLPTSVLIRKGHRIRVAIAGADSGTFARIPATGPPVLAVARNSASASAIDLPVRPR